MGDLTPVKQMVHHLYRTIIHQAPKRAPQKTCGCTPQRETHDRSLKFAGQKMSILNTSTIRHLYRSNLGGRFTRAWKRARRGKMISFDTAYNWLTRFEPSSLPYPARRLAAQLGVSLLSFKRGEVYAQLARLERLAADSSLPDAQAEGLVICALATYKMNNLRLAADFLARARQLYDCYDHKSAVVDWLQGEVAWGMTAEEDYEQAVRYWQRSMLQFEQLRAGYSLVHDLHTAWYIERLAEMRAALRDRSQAAMRRPRVLRPAPPAAPANEPPAAVPPPAGEWQPEYPADEAPIPVEIPVSQAEAPIPINMAIPVAGAAPDLYSTLFQLFPVSDSIPAGGFAGLGGDPHPIAYLQIDRVVIDEQTFRIESLRKNGKVINLAAYLKEPRRLAVLRVKGDSMNKVIADGAFVLIHLQNDAADGEIVVAGVKGVDTEATLKRLSRRDGEIVLLPESSNPAHLPRPIPPEMEGFTIIGIAVAALIAVE